MTAFSNEMAAVALELLTEFGEVVSFTREVKGAYDPDTLSIPTLSTITFSGYSVPVNYGAGEIDREIIQQSDIKLYVNAMSTIPEIGDTVLLNSVSYRVLNVIKYRVSGSTVLYELQVRI